MRKMPIPKEYLGAFKKGQRPYARSFIDDSLSYKLLEKVINHNCEESKRALEFIAKFNNEYHRGAVKKGDREAFHRKPKQRQACYNRKYAASVDVFALFDLVFIEDLKKNSRK